MNQDQVIAERMLAMGITFRLSPTDLRRVQHWSAHCKAAGLDDSRATDLACTFLAEFYGKHQKIAASELHQQQGGTTEQQLVNEILAFASRRKPAS